MVSYLLNVLIIFFSDSWTRTGNIGRKRRGRTNKWVLRIRLKNKGNYGTKNRCEKVVILLFIKWTNRNKYNLVRMTRYFVIQQEKMDLYRKWEICHFSDRDNCWLQYFSMKESFPYIYGQTIRLYLRQFDFQNNTPFLRW